jgi:hypothetical protein
VFSRNGVKALGLQRFIMGDSLPAILSPSLKSHWIAYVRNSPISVRRCLLALLVLTLTPPFPTVTRRHTTGIVRAGRLSTDRRGATKPIVCCCAPLACAVQGPLAAALLSLSAIPSTTYAQHCTDLHAIKAKPLSISSFC